MVMEPVKGSSLAVLPEETTVPLRALDPEASTASWAVRWVASQPGVTVILSGMSTVEQLEDNIRTFSQGPALSAQETSLVLKIAEGLKNSVPCTSCRYCCDGCPMGLDIPMMLAVYNDLRYAPSFNVSMRLEFLPEDKKPSACIGCGKCTKICPQNIDIPGALKDLSGMLETLPKWRDICRQREAAQAQK